MRRVKNAVPLVECKARCLRYMKERNFRKRNLMKANQAAEAIWPGVEFTSQGGGAAASRILKHLERDGQVHWTSSATDWGWALGPSSAHAADAERNPPRDSTKG